MRVLRIVAWSVLVLILGKLVFEALAAIAYQGVGDSVMESGGPRWLWRLTAKGYAQWFALKYTVLAVAVLLIFALWAHRK